MKKLQLKDIQHYPLDGSTKILIKHHSEEGWGKGTLTPNTLNDFNMKGYLIKPLLTSKLNEEELAEFWIIFIGGRPNKLSAQRGQDILDGKLNPSIDMKVFKEAMDFLYKCHYAFDTDKSLYIEKT